MLVDDKAEHVAPRVVARDESWYENAEREPYAKDERVPAHMFSLRVRVLTRS